MTRRKLAIAATMSTLLAAAVQPALAGGHTWRLSEVFSNADGTIQFIELAEISGGSAEVATGGHLVSSLTHTFTIPTNAVMPTSFKKILLGTPAFKALTGAPTVDYTIVANFFNPATDTIGYSTWDPSWPVSNVPTDGVTSLLRNNTTAVNSPTNYAGQSGSVNANPPAPAAVPAGSMTVTPLDTTGTSLQIAWDTATCTGSTQHQILFGQRSNLPAAPGGTFGLLGSVCGLGATSPFTWNGVPSDSDGRGLLWWVLTVQTQSTEGSWGKDSAGVERIGPGAGGSSGQCSITARSTTNTCGN